MRSNTLDWQCLIQIFNSNVYKGTEGKPVALQKVLTISIYLLKFTYVLYTIYTYKGPTRTNIFLILYTLFMRLFIIMYIIYWLKYMLKRVMEYIFFFAHIFFYFAKDHSHAFNLILINITIKLKKNKKIKTAGTNILLIFRSPCLRQQIVLRK